MGKGEEGGAGVLVLTVMNSSGVMSRVKAEGGSCEVCETDDGEICGEGGRMGVVVEGLRREMEEAAVSKMNEKEDLMWM